MTTDERALKAELDALARRGATIVQAITYVRARFGTPLGRAKALVTSHEAYRKQAEAAEALHDLAIDAALELARDGAPDARADQGVHSDPASHRGAGDGEVADPDKGRAR